MRRPFANVIVPVVVVLSALASIVEGPRWFHVLVAAVIVGAVGWWLAEGKLSVLRHVAGVECHYKGGVEEFKKVKSSYGYLGVSGRSVINDFKRFLSHWHGQETLRVRILSIHPYTDFVLDNQRLANPAAGAPEAGVESALIEAIAREYQGLARAGVQIEVRFYQAALHYWGHFLDHGEAVIGLRLTGQSGDECTALRLRHGSRGRENDLLRLFQEEFESLWGAATTVSAKSYFDAKAAATAAAGATP